MDPNRLVIPKDNFKNSIKELKVSNIDLWAKFSNKNLDASIKDFNSEAKKIFKITRIKDVKRTGIRRHYIYNPQQAIIDLSPLLKSKIESGELLSMTFDYVDPTDIKGNIRLEVLKDESNKRAILFDIDLYSTNNFDADDMVEGLNLVKETYKSKSLLSFVNSIVEAL